MKSLRRPCAYRQVDVFTQRPLSGNGLAVFSDARGMSAEFMQGLTQELRQFESIFLEPGPRPNDFTARIFTAEEELDFAGHPVVGAACVLHEALSPELETANWTLKLPARAVTVETRRTPTGFSATMHQGRPDVLGTLDAAAESRFLDALSLRPEDRDTRLPMEVCSTGLPYLIVPVRAQALAHAAIKTSEFEAQLASIGAKFVYLLDAAGREGRTWDNAGKVEDVATGSAAGPAAAFLVRRGLAAANTSIAIHQGRFVGRPSLMTVEIVAGLDGVATDVALTGDVVMVARGVVDDVVFRM